MKDRNRKPLYQQFTEKNNGLSATQEVLYQKEFKRAAKATQNNQNK